MSQSDPLSPEEYADEMNRFMRGERKESPGWTIPVINQKQQHMTPIEQNDPLLVDQISEILCRHNREEAAQLVGTVILPELQKKGIHFFRTSVNELKPTSDLVAALAPGQSTGEAHAVRMTTQDHMRKYEQEPEPKVKDCIVGKSPQVHTFDIGTAMNLVKVGKKVARSGWNGKNMFVYYVPAGNWKAATQVASQVFGNTVPYNHYLAIKNPNGTVSTWAPSGSDALATDWYIVD